MSDVEIPYSVIAPTAYGTMIVNRNDINQGGTLLHHGISRDHQEILLLSKLLKACPESPVFLDVGANFGTYSLGLAPVAGTVHAFEAQRILFNMLTGSVALNSLHHVFTHNLAVGDREGMLEVPQFDYSRPMNFGSIEFGPKQTEQLLQMRGDDPSKTEYVMLTTLDHYDWPRVEMIKIDVEGMELDVLNGAKELLSQFHPVLFVEYLKTDKQKLFDFLKSFDYKVAVIGLNYLAIPATADHLLSAVNA